jgi:catechol 2,3-dioxygenase-like lactoylglutathione lyase family enzyme
MEKPENKLTYISQVGLCVCDIDAAIAAMEKIFGVKPDRYGETPKTKRFYKGQEAEFGARLAFYNFANIEIELMQPIYGESDWTHFLANGREGLHHFRFSVDDFEAVVDTMHERGIDVLMEGRSIKSDKLRWALFDTEDLVKFPVEIFNDLQYKPEEL